MPPKRVAKKKKCNDEFLSEFQMDEISQQVEMAGMNLCAAKSTKSLQSKHGLQLLKP